MVYMLLLLVWLCGIGFGYALRGMLDRKKRGEPVFPLRTDRGQSRS
jgi:hypothetical protein